MKARIYKVMLIFFISFFLTFSVAANCYAKSLSISPSVSGDPGSSVSVNVIMDNPSGIAGGEFRLNYDSNVLEYVSSEKGDVIPGISITSDLAGTGSNRYVYANFADLADISQEAESILYTFNFTVKATAYKNSDLQFSNTDFSNADLDTVAVASVNSTFTITDVTTTVLVTPASTTDVAAGQPVTMTAQVLINGTEHECVSTSDVTFATSGNGSFGTKSIVSGEIQSAYTTHTTVETATITATEALTGNSNSGTATATSIAGDPDAGTSAVVADPTTDVSVSSDGSSSSTVTVTIKDSNNNPVSGQTVNITLTGTGNYIDGMAYTVPVDLATPTSASGVATFQLSSIKAETKTITAKVGATTITDTATVAFAATAFDTGNSTVETSAAEVTTDGGATAIITVTLIDVLDNPVPGQTVTLTATGTDNAIVQPAAVTDASGQATGTIASTKAEAKTVTAKVGADTVGTVAVTFTPGTATQFSVAAVKSTLASEGKGTTTLTATVKDANGNVVTSDSGRTVAFAVTTGTYLKVVTASPTTTDGVATTTITTQGAAVPTSPPTTDTVTATSTGLTGDPGSVEITIVNFSIDVTSPAAPFYDTSTGVHLVTSGSTPKNGSFTGLGSTTGDYLWALTGVGTIDSTTADSITYTAPATIEGSSQEATLTLTSASDGELTDSVTITIYNPLAITSPTEEIGIAKDNTSYGSVGVSGGTTPYEFQSTTMAVATVDAVSGDITPVATGTFTVQVRDATYGIFETVNGFYAVSLQIEIVDPITITPATPSVDASGTQTFTATGGKGGYTWSCSNADAGTINATTGVFTAAAVTTKQTATITATDGTYTDITGTATVTVYPGMAISETPAGYVDGTPSTYPLLSLGETTTLKAADATRTYDWTVEDWESTQVGTTVTATTFDVVPADLFAANGAGIYTVTLTDQDNPGLTATTLKVRVPMKFVATKFIGANPEDAGTYNDNQGTDTYTITGGPTAVNVYTYSALDLDGVEVTAENCGSFADDSPTDADNVFDFTNGIDEMASFRVKVALDSASDDADVARLIEAGLDTLWSGVFRVVPIVSYSGTLVDTEGLPVGLAMITCTSDLTKTAITDVTTGEFTITGFSKSGVTYKFFIQKGGYIDKIVTGDEIEAGDIVLEALAVGGGTIDGTVTLSDGSPYGLISIQVKTDAGDYIKDGEGSIITSLASPADGSYTFSVSGDYVDAGPFTLEFKTTGYIFDEDAGLGVLTAVALGATTADITLKPVTIISVTGTPQDSDVDGTDDQVLVKITAEAGTGPWQEFDGTAAEIKVEDADGNAVTLDAFETVGVGTKAWSFTHDAYENFTITVYADVSDDRDVDNGYKATKSWTYVKSATTPTTTDIPNPNVDGGVTPTTIGGTDVNLPPGGLTGDILDSVTVAIVEADASVAGATQITGSEIVEVVMTDENGDPVDNADIQRIEITIKFDPAVVTEGSLDAGTYVIYQATSLADMVAGTATAVPTSQIIQPVDYANGYVTFWVNHLSVFGIGGSSGSSPLSSSNCFIATAAYGSPFESHVKILRDFRDVYLLPTKAGSAFVDAYYRLSPPIADFIAVHDTLRAAVRVGLMPAVGAGYVALHTTSAQKIMVIVLMLGLLAGAFVAIRRFKMTRTA